MLTSDRTTSSAADVAVVTTLAVSAMPVAGAIGQPSSFSTYSISNTATPTRDVRTNWLTKLQQPSYETWRTKSMDIVHAIDQAVLCIAASD